MAHGKSHDTANASTHDAPAAVEHIALLPVYKRVVIADEHLDLMGHMNVRHYMGIFDEAGWALFHALGMTPEYYREHQAGGFALQQFITYRAEVRKGETVAVHVRLLGRSARRLHMMYFMVNETTHKLAATMEALGSHADMTTRRTSPYPPHIAEKIDAIIAEHNRLEWDAPTCGVIHP